MELELLIKIKDQAAEIKRQKALLVRAADMLSLSHTVFDKDCGVCQLIQTLRKAAI